VEKKVIQISNVFKIEDTFCIPINSKNRPESNFQTIKINQKIDFKNDELMFSSESEVFKDILESEENMKDRLKSIAPSSACSASFWRIKERVTEISKQLEEIRQNWLVAQHINKDIKNNLSCEYKSALNLIIESGKAGSAVKQHLYIDLARLGNMLSDDWRLQFSTKDKSGSR